MDTAGTSLDADAARERAAAAFREGTARVEVRVDVTDVAAARAALAAGFRYEGVARGGLDGVHDVAVFARLATDDGEPVRPALPHLPPEGLSDGVVTLRLFRAEDAEAAHEQDADPVTLATGFTGIAPSLELMRRRTAQAGLEFLVGGGAAFAIVDAATDAVAGGLRLRYAGPPQVGGLGYVVHPRFRGRRYAARALRLLVPWAFEQADFARLELGAKQDNVASQKAALAAGFEQDGPRTGRLRNPDGTFGDEARFFLLNPRYR